LSPHNSSTLSFASLRCTRFFSRLGRAHSEYSPVRFLVAPIGLPDMTGPTLFQALGDCKPIAYSPFDWMVVIRLLKLLMMLGLVRVCVNRPTHKEKAS